MNGLEEKYPVIDGRDWNTAKKIVKQAGKYSITVTQDKDRDYAFLIQGEMPEELSVDIFNEYNVGDGFFLFKNGTAATAERFLGTPKITKYNEHIMQVEYEGAGKKTSLVNYITISERIGGSWKEVIKVPYTEIVRMFVPELTK